MELLQHLILVPVLLVLCSTETDCIPVGQFFPRGDEVLSLPDDGSSDEIPLSQPYPVLGRQWTSLWVNSNGVISLNRPFGFFSNRFFPNIRNGVILCPFWIDLDPRSTGTVSHNRGSFDGSIATRVAQFIQQSLGYNFTPTGIFIATWEGIPLFSIPESTNTFQCVLATNGQDTLIFFLYADGLITGRGALVGVDGNDGVNYFTVQGTHPSNTGQPGLWIFKADGHIIGGPPDSLTDLLVVNVGTTEATLEWTHSVNNIPESFRITCLPPVASAASNTTATSQTHHANFTYFLTGLNEYTNYTCNVTAINLFGDGPPSDPIDIATDPAAPSGPPLNVTGEVLSPTSLVFEWSPPSEEERNGPLTGYSVVLQWEVGQEHRVDTADTSYTFTELQQGTTYHCFIAARTSIGTGPYYHITVATPIVTTAEPASTITPIVTTAEPQTFPEDPASTDEMTSTEMRSAEMRTMKFGLIGGASGGTGILVVVIIVVIVFFACVKYREKKMSNEPTSPDLEMEDRSVKIHFSGTGRSNTYVEDPSKQAAIEQYHGGAKNNFTLPPSTPAASYGCTNPMSLYMPLRHNGKQEENSQYASLCDATRERNPPILPPKPKALSVSAGSTPMEEANIRGKQTQEENYETINVATEDPELSTLPQKVPVPGTNSDNVYMPLRRMSQGQEEQENLYEPLCTATIERRHLTLPPKPFGVSGNTNPVCIRGRQSSQEEQYSQHADTKVPKPPTLPPKPQAPRTNANSDNAKKPQSQEEQQPLHAPTREKRSLTLPPKPQAPRTNANSKRPQSKEEWQPLRAPTREKRSLTLTPKPSVVTANPNNPQLPTLPPKSHTSTNSDGAYTSLRKQEEQKMQYAPLCAATSETSPRLLAKPDITPVPPRPPKSKFK